MKNESSIFEHGKTYRFLPCKSFVTRHLFTRKVRRATCKYDKSDIWELRLKSNVFTYKGEDRTSIRVDGFIINRNWVEEVK